MKMKILTVALCIAVLICATMLCTVAYLTDTSEAVNTFTVGKVHIELDEAAVNTDGEPIANGAVVNSINDADRTEKGNEYHLIPGKTYVKDPTVNVIAGSEKAYIRMIITVNKLSELDAIFAPNGAELLSIFNGYDSNVWILSSEFEADNTKTYEFRYYTSVDAADVKDDITLEPLFTSFTVPDNLDSDALKSIDGLVITAIGNAIQKSGFNNEDEAWKAFDLQNK